MGHGDERPLVRRLGGEEVAALASRRARWTGKSSRKKRATTAVAAMRWGCWEAEATATHDSTGQDSVDGRAVLPPGGGGVWGRPVAREEAATGGGASRGRRASSGEAPSSGRGR